MKCPSCDTDNLPGENECRYCGLDLTQLDVPVPQDHVEQSLMADPVRILGLSTTVTLPPSAPVAEAIRVMLERNIGSVLIVDDTGALVGIFSERDLLMKVCNLAADQRNRSVGEFMTHHPETVRESDSLAFALHKMDVGGYRHLPVLREGKLVGVVSVRDMLEHITTICATSAVW
jgi:CBS domain-containing protein